MTASVLVIEDNRDIAELLRHALGVAGHDVEIAFTRSEGASAVERAAPDVVLLDLDLPDGDGLELLPMLRRKAPVIVLTGRHSDDSVVAGLELGAEDYVTKPFSPRVLLARIDAVMRRQRGESATVVVRGPLVIDVGGRTAILDGRPLDLTRRELDLLTHLALNPTVVLSREDLLEAVWDSSGEWQTPATVTEHVRRLRLKLGDERWIESVRGVGYRFEIPAAEEATG